MDYKITKIETLIGSTLLYVEVEFLASDRVTHRNDFLMQIPPTQTKYVGPPLRPPADPTAPVDIDPADLEETTTNVRAEITANIERYLARLETPERQRRLQPDGRDRRLRSSATDPLGLIARPGVADLVGRRRQRGDP